MLTDEQSCDKRSFPAANHAAPESTMKDSFEECSHGALEPREEPPRNGDATNCQLNGPTIHLTDPAEDFALEHLPSAMLANSANSLEPRKPNLACNENNLNESLMNFANDPRDKIWSLIDSVGSEEFGGQPFADSMNPNISFTDPSLLSKRAITGVSAGYNSAPLGSAGAMSATRSPLSMGSSNQFYGTAAADKNAPSLNWPPVQSSPQSHMTWSNNSFNSTLPSVPSLNSTSNTSASNSIHNVWSNNAYGGLNHPKRTPLGNQTGSNVPIKKSVYASENQAMMGGHGALSPSKYRRNQPISNFKSYANHVSGPSTLYELGSAGSDNTSSSSDSANLRENGLLHLQERNLDSHCGPLDSLRYSLEPQLLEIMRGNSTQDNKGFNFNLPYQSTAQDDKKHLKGRNFGRRRGKSPFFTGNDESLLADFTSSNNDHNERYSRKVFVGGLPPDIDEEEITASFRRFGPLVVDWPHKAESKSYFPPKGYAFLLFQDEASVQMLIDACIQEEEKLYLCVSSPTIKDKPVQIRPWRLSDADYVLDASMPLDPRKTVFVGGVPRPLKAVELAMIMDRLYGGVCYAGIDTDPELKYPKGAGRVAFSNQQSYIAAISARFVQLQHADIEKRVEVKPYVLDDQSCDECQGQRCGGKFAPYFCANITCLQYYCENCWASIHSRPGREFHKPLVKEGADRPRAVPFRWC